MNEALFMEATRKKYRFNFKGEISVEELWDLNLDSLDEIYIKLKAEQRKQDNTESFLKKKNQADVLLSKKIELLEVIMKTKQDEAAMQESTMLLNQRRQELMEELDRKKKALVKEKSIEELEEELKKL
jgi:hypothetical protein